MKSATPETDNPRFRARTLWIWAALAGASLVAYFPALSGGFVWDDMGHVTRPDLRSLHGLWRIWFELGATQQYYPVLHSAFWVEHRLWGDAPLGYHVLNVLLHATAAFLFGLVLQRLWRVDEASSLGVDEASSLVSTGERGWKPRLRFSAPMFAAFAFALHPVCVESVAWISEQKNTLSAVFYLLAMLAYLKYDQFSQGDREENLPRHFHREIGEVGGQTGGHVALCGSTGTLAGSRSSPSGLQPILPDLPVKKNNGTATASRSSCKKWYFVSLLLFILAVLSKSVTATLPAALLVILWWKRGALSWKRDVVPLLPFFAVGIAGGLFTAWVEQRYGGAEGAPYALGGLDRCLLAGRVVAFYLAKLLWPAHLIFIYHRWRVTPAEAWQWVFPLAVLAVLAILWRLRRRSRTPLAAALFFVGTLFPALGFFNVFPFAYSYVADHFQYLAMLGVIALGTGGWSALSKRSRRGILPRFSFDTRQNASSTTSDFQAARAPLALSLPRPCSPALSLSKGAFPILLLFALGFLTWSRAHAYRDSDTLYRDTLAQNPECWMARTNLGVELAARGRINEAIAQYDLALKIDPSLPTVHDDLGSAYFSQGRTELAVDQFEEALRLRPAYPEAIYNLSVALEAEGHPAQAIDGFYRALRMKPNFFEARYNLAMALGGAGRTAEAAAEFQRALKIRPDFAPAHYNLGIALQALGRAEEAKAQFARARSLGFSP